MTVRMRHTRSHTGNRRSHHALRAIRLAKCTHCGQNILPHTVCVNCGKYQGRQVIDVMARLSKKEQKQKAKELRAQEEVAAAEKPLDAGNLSRK